MAISLILKLLPFIEKETPLIENKKSSFNIPYIFEPEFESNRLTNTNNKTMKKLLILISLICLMTTTGFSRGGDKNNEKENSEVNSLNLIAEAFGDQIMISWLVAEQSKFEKIEIEKAENLEAFKTIQTLNLGFSKHTLAYKSVDSKPAVGQNNYRLRFVNKDGSSTYSEIVSIGYRKLSHDNSTENLKSTEKQFVPPTMNKFDLSSLDLLSPKLSQEAA